jgi:hypothetical protein
MERQKQTDNRIKAFLARVVVSLALAVLWPAAALPATAAARAIVSPLAAVQDATLVAGSSLARWQEARSETPASSLRRAMRATLYRGPICPCAKAARRPSRPVSALPLTSAVVSVAPVSGIFLRLNLVAFKRPSSPHISSGAPRAPPVG